MDNILELKIKIKNLEEECFKMSAQIEYLERLVHNYEMELSPEIQDSIKNFIFSEDDR